MKTSRILSLFDPMLPYETVRVCLFETPMMMIMIMMLVMMIIMTATTTMTTLTKITTMIDYHSPHTFTPP